MRGLSFNEQMIRAWMEGRKTITRRLMKPQPPDNPALIGNKKWGIVGKQLWYRGTRSPYLPGETVYIKEVWNFCAPDQMLPWEVGYPWHGNKALRVIFKADFCGDKYPDHPEWGKAMWRPSIHLSEKDARSHARIVSIRPEQIQSITDEEIAREGLDVSFRKGGIATASVRLSNKTQHSTARECFRSLWDSIYPGSWERNDWCWVYTLKKLDK